MTEKTSFARPLVWELAVRFLFGRGGEGGRLNFRRVRGGVVGIALSLIPLVVVFVVANGMIGGITARFLETGSYHLQAVSRSNRSIEQIQPIASDLAQLPEVRSAFVEVQGLGLLAGGQGHSGVQIRGIDPAMPEADAAFKTYMEVREGSFDLSGDRLIVLGENLAETLGISVGDPVRIITIRSSGGGRSLPRVSRFQVSGIVSSGYRELDSLWAFVSSESAQRVLPPGEQRSVIGIKIDDPFSLEPSAGALAQMAGIEESLVGNTESVTPASDAPDTGSAIIEDISAKLDSTWHLYTWYELERSQYMSFLTTRNLLMFIMVLIVLVAAVNISSAMIMLVLEKQEEIAMLKALGWPKRKLLVVFVLAGGVTGALGTVIGLSLGTLAAYNVNWIIRAIEYGINVCGYAITWLFHSGMTYVPIELFNPDFYLSSIPVRIQASDILTMAGVSIALSLLMSLLPAMRAVKLKPIDLLHRH